MNWPFRFYRAWKYRRLTVRPSCLALLSRFRDLSPENVEVRPADGGLYLRGTDVRLDRAERHFLLEGIRLAENFLRHAGARLEAATEGGGVILTCGGVKLLLENWQELFIAHEVFFGHHYNLRSREPFHLVDIGMNVGTATLFFAAQERCRGVDAFELFPPTARRAEKNFALNPQLTGKIRVTMAGLAATGGDRELDYCPEVKGSIGLGGIPGYVQAAATEKVRVKILPAAEALRPILAQHPGLRFGCKMDCEGAEYEIMENLDAAGLLGRFGFFLMEWHGQGPAPLVARLEKNGFEVLTLDSHGPNHGMIYAWQAKAG